MNLRARTCWCWAAMLAATAAGAAEPKFERPLRGHIGFQDLSESGEVLMFRNVRIAELD